MMITKFKKISDYMAQEEKETITVDCMNNILNEYLVFDNDRTYNASVFVALKKYFQAADSINLPVMQTTFMLANYLTNLVNLKQISNFKIDEDIRNTIPMLREINIFILDQMKIPVTFKIAVISQENDASAQSHYALINDVEMMDPQQMMMTNPFTWSSQYQGPIMSPYNQAITPYIQPSNNPQGAIMSPYNQVITPYIQPSNNPQVMSSGNNEVLNLNNTNNGKNIYQKQVDTPVINKLEETQKYLIGLIDNKFDTNNELLDKIYKLLSEKQQKTEDKPTRDTINPTNISNSKKPLNDTNIKEKPKSNEINSQNKTEVKIAQSIYCIPEDVLKRFVKDKDALAELEKYRGIPYSVSKL